MEYIVNQKQLLKGFKKPKNIIYKKKEVSKNYGKFIIYPFERGFGHTIGNTFRRVLLSSIPGYAISAIRINVFDENNNVKPVSSGFELIPEVYEETFEVIKNLKDVKLRLLNEIESKTIHLERKGTNTITASDLAIDDTIEVINGDLKLLTLTEKANIELELQIDLGRGYVDAERQEEYIETVNTIPIDANYSPIEKVKYEVENTRVGQRTDYDKLIFEVWTDGTLSPEDAIAGSAKILKDHFQIFINFEEEEEEEEVEENKEDEELKVLLETPVDELELSVRASNCLRSSNIRLIGELVSKTEEEISKIRHFGKKSLIEIKEKLIKHKLSFGMKDIVDKILNKEK
jgi:DNA-directed RNA polymerase subunit alpha